MKNQMITQKAKSMLPNMPDEVFNTWLLPIIKDHNQWPYADVFSSHPSDQWEKYFAFFTLAQISSCYWTQIELTFDKSCIDSVSNQTIDVLISKHVHNIDKIGNFNVRNSEKRFWAFVEFIKKTRNIPPPIIGLNTEDGLRVLDGNHRLAALTYLKLRGKIRCLTWVGAPGKSAH